MKSEIFVNIALNFRRKIPYTLIFAEVFLKLDFSLKLRKDYVYNSAINRYMDIHLERQYNLIQHKT